MDLITPAAPRSVEYGNDGQLLERVLTPYKPHCRYLKSATVTRQGEPRDGGRVSARAEFGIPESCYIDDTGHFNSVEFNLCFNQLVYYLLAKSVKERAMWPFSTWTLDEFWDRQLPDILIVDFRSTFRRAMRGRGFWGEIDVVGIDERDGDDGSIALVSTLCRYGEEEMPACHGGVRLAVRMTRTRAA
ncbi:FcoT family thioesterase [Streptomyces buecherae]|uniref:FcoT family thioesterase n=1 Tax=Streptomyces buecherae TaxID=2763006 RepID=UPI0033DA6EA9